MRSIPAAEAYLRPSKTVSLLCSLFGKSASSTRDKIEILASILVLYFPLTLYFNYFVIVPWISREYIFFPFPFLFLSLFSSTLGRANRDK